MTRHIKSGLLYDYSYSDDIVIEGEKIPDVSVEHRFYKNTQIIKYTTSKNVSTRSSSKILYSFGGEIKDGTFVNDMVQIVLDKTYEDLMDRYLMYGDIQIETQIEKSIESISKYIGSSYAKEGNSSPNYLRTAETAKALEKMDCSEFVSRYIKELLGEEKVEHRNTIKLDDYFGKNKDTFVEQNKKYKPKKGDIFLWFNHNGNHTGIVLDYDQDTDEMKIIDASGSKDLNKVAKRTKKIKTWLTKRKKWAFYTFKKLN